MKPHHKGFENDAILRRIAQALRIGCSKTDGLFAEYVFPGAGGLKGERNMLIVWQRIVDYVDPGICEEIGIRTIGSRYPQSVSGIAGLFE